MYVVGVGLGKVYKALLSLVSGVLSVFLHLNKTSATQEPWVVKPDLWSLN